MAGCPFQQERPGSRGGIGRRHRYQQRERQREKVGAEKGVKGVGGNKSKESHHIKELRGCVR